MTEILTQSEEYKALVQRLVEEREKRYTETIGALKELYAFSEDRLVNLKRSASMRH